MDDDRPPILPSWPAWYALVVVWLSILIAVFYTFRLAFE
jgi:hypothetical protein